MNAESTPKGASVSTGIPACTMAVPLHAAVGGTRVVVTDLQEVDAGGGLGQVGTGVAVEAPGGFFQCPPVPQDVQDGSLLGL